MSAVKAVAEMMEAALGGITDVPTHRDPGANITPPATVLGVPALRWEALDVSPTSARFIVYAIVDPDERAPERLWDLVELVSAAIDENTDGVVISAEPAGYVSGSGATPLPCYEITVEVPLR
jgi:hypothetical protein